jgi:hypothetical protein
MSRLSWRPLPALTALTLLACSPRPPATPGASPASPDQALADAVQRLCDTPRRADQDPDAGRASRSDLIAKHLTDGVGHERVLLIAEGWKTEGIRIDELEALVKEAGLAHCPLRGAAGA